MCKHQITEDLLNPEGKPLTIEKLRTFEGFETISDQEAEDIINQINLFCLIVLQSKTQLINYKEENQ